MAEGITIHRSKTAGQEWACGAGDHGPFCRLDQPVTPELAASLDRVESGELVARIDRDGRFQFTEVRS